MLYCSIFKTINFRYIIFTDAVFLVTIFLILLQIIKKLLPEIWLTIGFIFSICIFDIDGFENAYFAMAGMQNYGIILLFVGSLLSYSLENKKYIPLASALQIICIFSSGNGNVAAFFILVFTLLNKDRLKIIVATCSFLIFAPLYYLHYKQPDTNFFTLDPSKFLAYFFHSIGAHISYVRGIAAGIVILATFLLCLPINKKIKIQQNTLILLCISGFLFSSMGVMSIFRGNLPINCSYASRYFIYSHLILAITITFLLLKINKHALRIKFLSCAILYLMFIYAENYNEGKNAFEAQYALLKNTDFGYPDKVRAKQVTDESCKLGIYCIEDAKAQTK